MDWVGFRDVVKANALPLDELAAKRYWVGVYRHVPSPGPVHIEKEDFLWIKAHAKVTVDKILSTYLQNDPRVANAHLSFQGSALEPSMTVKELNIHGDNIVVLNAEPTPSRIPFQSVNRQMTAPPAPATQQNDKRHHSAGQIPEVAVKQEARSEHPWNLPMMPSSDCKENITTAPAVTAQRPAHPNSLHSAPQPSDSAHESRTPNTLSSTVRDHLLSAPSRSVPSSTSPAPKISASVSDLKAERPRSPSRSPTPGPIFDPGDVFDHDLEVKERESRPSDVLLRQIIDQQDPELLEAGVAKSLKILDTFRTAFSQQAHISEDASAWAQSIDKLIAQAERKRTVVGVVGNTGAGKSSVINAMLDEERLVPTNCMRACTAVVTELSWNNSTDIESKYRGEIEFIAASDWEKELGALLKEFLTESGAVARETSDPSTDAGIAWAKFHAVYPQKTKEMLAGSTVQSLMADRSVLKVLGTTKYIKQANPEPFYTALQRYVDSKEKITGKSKEKGRSTSQMEYWPLIKVVKIYTKSAALSTGAVIVDLPGVHDSNAARAAVAHGYMKQCTGLWIVAPINRAVDDKAAKTLLGESFKRQLKYDGGFSAVTFICSKTDDISITEASDSLELGEEISELEIAKCKHRDTIKSLESKIESLREAKDVYKEAMESAETDQDVWEDLKEQLEEGETVYAPEEKSKKRKKGGRTAGHARKRRQVDSDASEEEFVGSDDDSGRSNSDSESDSEGIRAPRTPLTEDNIKERIEELKAIKKNARRQRTNLESEIKDILPQIKAAKAQRDAILAEMNAICIAGRNNYSKGAIQIDFATGIRELDQENAAEEDEEEFDPDTDRRDYDAVARCLPVFCVSSRAYQKMCGRLQKDSAVPGFKTPQDTEIPQLQAHCKKLTEAGRVQSCRTFLLNLCQHLTTFSFWASDDGSGIKLTDEEKSKQVKYLEKRLEELDKGLEKAIEACIEAVKKEMDHQIFEQFPELISEAISNAPGIAQGWGAHRSEGGLPWATYKAIVRRDGVYHSASAGHRDFNAALIEPIMTRLTTRWERAFQRRIPKAFETYTAHSSSILHHFHGMIEKRAQENGVGLANISVLKNQIYNHEQLFKELGAALVVAMNELQRDANRDFTPAIVAIMHNGYDICANEHGKGSFMRMKAAMATHVDTERHRMFSEATETVKKHLHTSCRKLQDTMAEKVDEIFCFMRRDYLTVLGGVQVNQDAPMSREERNFRASINNLLLGVDEQFRAIANGEIETEETEVVPSKTESGDEIIEDGEEEREFSRKPSVGATLDREVGEGSSTHSKAVPDVDMDANTDSSHRKLKIEDPDEMGL